MSNRPLIQRNLWTSARTETATLSAMLSADMPQDTASIRAACAAALQAYLHLSALADMTGGAEIAAMTEAVHS